MKRLKIGQVRTVVAVATAIFAFAGPALAVTRWVNDDDPNGGSYAPPGTSCTDPGYPTIQDAIDDAVAGDIINVCAGTYPETAAGPLAVNKTLILRGAQAGVDARTPRGAESIVTDPTGTSVSASNVVIDGFTVQDSVATAFTGFGIWLNPLVSGTQIVNNIIQNNIVGIGLANAGASPPTALIQHNLIRNNTQPGAASGSGIYTDQFVGGPTVRNVLVNENAFSGHAGFGGVINISNTDPAGGVFNLEVSNNSFNTDSRAVVWFNTHDSTIHDNNIVNSTFVGSAAIRLFDNNTNLSILRNNLISGTGHAIRLSDLGLVGGPSSNVVIHENNIAFYTLTGLTVDAAPPGHVGTVNAECNWWNSPSGPTNANNPGGTGEEVVGDADFTPWLDAPFPGGECEGGADDEDDFDEDGERDDEDEDDDNDGERDGEDEDDDNDGERDGEDEDDDNDGIDDEDDSESHEEKQQSFKSNHAAWQQTDYAIQADANTLLVIAVAEAPNAELLTVEIFNAAGALVATSLSTPGRAVALAPALSPGTYTARVRNASSEAIASTTKLIIRRNWLLK